MCYVSGLQNIKYMGTSDRICRKCKREGLQKALDIVIMTVAPCIHDDVLDGHKLVAKIAERLQEEIVKNLDVQ